MAVTSEILLHASLVEQSRSIVYIRTGMPALGVSEINELSERITIKNNVNSIDINIKTHTLDIVLYVPDILPDFIINDEEEEVEV